MRLLLAALMILCVAPAAGQGMRASAVADEAVTMVIRPSVTNFRREADGLHQAVMALCAEPSERGLRLARDRFTSTLLSYGRIELLTLGPATEENRAARLLAPVSSQVADAATLDAGIGPAEGTSGLAPGQQGLGALELILFAPESTALTAAAGARRCGYGLAMAEEISIIGEALLAGWYSPRGVALRIMAPRPEYPDYRTDADTIAALASVLATGVARIGERLEALRDGRGEQFAASGQTLAMVAANLSGLESLYRLSGIGRAADDGAVAHTRITAAFEALTAAVEQGAEAGLSEFATLGAQLERDLAALPAIVVAD
jgi:predicted lipoprotein